IGRKDHMVKISGFRIELSEIITTLLKYEKVEEAAVTAVYDENRGSKIIYAFITVKKDQSCSIIALKEFCSRKLPYYMVPEIIISIDTIPRNTNGKVDAKKLLEFI
ncbi:MAG: hypothetical protein OQK82_07125, partial [Candidatus Pacearchaeota archaeon]|nr:hypothetical protein [Candidatus Pacearchaeota archaeon]